MEIQVTASEFRHFKATACLKQPFFAIHFEYIELMKLHIKRERKKCP